MAKAETGTGRELPRMLIVRTGWMTYYAGSLPGDERPARGGAFNREEIGHELFNFLDLDGMLRGYAQPALSSNTINLERIDPAATSDQLENVLVVFIATHPEGGQVVTGWYRHSLVYRFFHEETDRRRSLDGTYFAFYFQTSSSDAVLLPLNERTLRIPTGAGAMGRTNVFYPYDGAGLQRNLLWLEQVVDFVETYSGENLLNVAKGGLEEAAVKAAELAESATGGQGFLRPVAIRQAVERRAMAVAKRYFGGLNWRLANHSATKPYDLWGTKDGEELFIEVKGTQGDGGTVFLTPREVEWARSHHPHTALAIVTGIEISETETQAEARKGEIRVIQPWYPDEDSLEPLAYKFRTGLTTSP